MATTNQYTTVTFTVTGANPQVRTAQATLAVDNTTGLGSGSLTFTYTGTNIGADTVTASISSPISATSNSAAVVWQQASGLIALLDPVSVGVFHNGQSGNFDISSPVPFDYTVAAHSLLFNPNSSQVTVPGYSGPNLGFNQTPGEFLTLTSAGQWAGSAASVFLQNGDGNNGAYKMVMTGSFVVAAAGTYTLNISVDDSYILGIGSAVSGGGTATAGAGNNLFNEFSPPQTASVYKGYPIIMEANAKASVVSAQSPNPRIGTVTFSAPGIYPFEVDYNQYEGNGGYFTLTYNGGSGYNGTMLVTVTGLVSPPPQPSPGTGPLQLTPTGGPNNLLIQGQQVTLTLTMVNIQFVTQRYMPVLEGSVGQVYICNNASSIEFDFPPPYNTHTPDGPSAAADDFTLVGDNTAWQGQVALRWDASAPVAMPGQFELYYNGSGTLQPGQLFPANTELTNLTVTQGDIAWFSPTGPEYDVFQATASGGGKLAAIPVYYLLNPNFPAGNAVQVSPTTVVADGTQKTFTVTLARPLPPLQNNTVLAVTFSGTVPTGVTVTPNMGSGNFAQWLVSYTVKATWASLGSASSSTMLFAFTAPTITFLGTLGGAVDAFHTLTNYPYAPSSPQAQAVITLQAASTPTPGGQPVNVSLQEKVPNAAGTQLTPDNGQTYPPHTTGFDGNLALIATFISPNNNFKAITFYINATNSGPYAAFTATGAPVVTSLGNGTYKMVFTYQVPPYLISSLFSGPPYSSLTTLYTYQFSYYAQFLDGTSVGYADTNYYDSENTPPSQ